MKEIRTDKYSQTYNGYEESVDSNKNSRDAAWDTKNKAIKDIADLRSIIVRAYNQFNDIPSYFGKDPETQEISRAVRQLMEIIAEAYSKVQEIERQTWI